MEGGGVGACTGSGAIAGAEEGAAAGAGCCALLIGGTADLVRVSAGECVFFLEVEIRSVASAGGAVLLAGASALGVVFWEESFLLLARVAMKLSL
ncbi:MAG TPA: hypothetical protein VNY32_07150 [Candidatus Acidoferrales bacterium]|nr:hypothetical protein [Candidatus Acidoferrales bacterium]